MQWQIKEDLNSIKNSKKIFVKANKSNSLCPDKYNGMFHKEVTKHYKKAPINLETELNKEASILANKF